MTTRWERIALQTAGERYAASYAERFRRLAESGADIHGEATFAASLVAPPARVLDAGCGTGRVAVRLHELGYDVVGVDLDASMVAEARAAAPHLDWRVADLATLDLAASFDLVIVAGNTIPLLEEGTLVAACDRLAAHTAPAGTVLTGFGLDPGHLPGDCPVTSLAEVDAAMTAAGLEVGGRWSTWTGEAFAEDRGYVVASYRRPA